MYFFILPPHPPQVFLQEVGTWREARAAASVSASWRVFGLWHLSLTSAKPRSSPCLALAMRS